MINPPQSGMVADRKTGNANNNPTVLQTRREDRPQAVELSVRW